MKKDTLQTLIYETSRQKILPQHSLELPLKATRPLSRNSDRGPLAWGQGPGDWGQSWLLCDIISANSHTEWPLVLPVHVLTSLLSPLGIEVLRSWLWDVMANSMSHTHRPRLSLLAVCPWAGAPASLSLSFFNCAMMTPLPAPRDLL